MQELAENEHKHTPTLLKRPCKFMMSILKHLFMHNMYHTCLQNTMYRRSDKKLWSLLQNMSEANVAALGAGQQSTSAMQSIQVGDSQPVKEDSNGRSNEEVGDGSLCLHPTNQIHKICRILTSCLPFRRGVFPQMKYI